ncbi:hypothetical protein Ciccas_006822 [Cichlidogyrus casuarinus]|uniref:Uncharacterized protein n=1 Tax=Cichlidogyrus casuarinus TaxID=1844966 RepID=A0ABD2Q4V5_9PLAT
MPKTRSRKIKPIGLAYDPNCASDESPSINGDTHRNSRSKDTSGNDSQLEEEVDVSDEEDQYSTESESTCIRIAHVCQLPQKELSIEEINCLPFLCTSSKLIKDSYIIVRNIAVSVCLRKPLHNHKYP